MRAAVHPRACGEHASQSPAAPEQIGSSPRLRGTRRIAVVAAAGRRFIPAPAGNTRRSVSLRALQAVHPRACGEHGRSSRQAAAGSGSSPRLRGTLDHQRDDQLYLRFIPAPAGNTVRPPVSGGNQSVHPRACGEHQSRRSRRGCQCGSSPRLRGTPDSAQPGAPRRRFIPAPAGNTCREILTAELAAVHPRACGEHVAASRASLSARGSSPRLRGTLRMQRIARPPARFIPAPAGNTAPRRS